MKTKQIMKLNCLETHGKYYTVVFHFGENNPFWLYEHNWIICEYGYPVEHKHIVVKYANMDSVFYHLLQTGVFEKDHF